MAVSIGLLILSLSACGGGGSSDNTTTGTTGTTDTTPTILSDILDLPTVTAKYSNPTLPAHFSTTLVQGFDNTPNNTQLNDGVATLGRVLFYEKQLSANNTISCSSCHIQGNGFSDPDRFSHGFQGGLTSRNSMGLANARFYENGHFFWDERAATLAEQTLTPIQNDIEMGLTLEQAVANLSGTTYQPLLFEQAYGDHIITAARIAEALSQFVRSMVSYQSKYDQGVAQNFSNFSATENRGRELFFSHKARCAGCHINKHNNGNQAIFQANETFNNGLNNNLINDDNGVGDVTGNSQDNGRFKVPSLRNIELTAPYMHDGRFTNLASVVEHYNSGVQNHPNLDHRLREGGANGAPRRLNLSNQEKLDLVSFLKTLTDDTFLTDAKFSNPFKPN